MDWQLPIGAQPDKNGVRFRLWAPDARQVDVVLLGDDKQEKSRHALKRDASGYFEGYVRGVKPGSRYMYLLNGDNLRPDLASRYQPEGVHGPSEVVDPTFEWSDQSWHGIPLEEMVLYEVHIGTATAEGTFEAFIGKLDHVKSLGVTAIEIMPVADFPGRRNWGYDGVDLFAPASAYGGPEGLKKLVDAAHKHGLAVVQDVVYNHFGPDGNYLRDFSRDYFTSDKKTPWGDAVNFSSRPVRDFFIANALYWVHEYHMDGLRLDATHAILDDSEEHILKELATIRESVPRSRHITLFAEDERNKAWLITTPEQGGAGIDAVWADDFHHQVRSAFAGDNEGYYTDYTGSAADLAETLNKGWFYTGQRSRFSGKKRGTDASALDPPHFVYCIQNHDQIGNRALGDRLNSNITPDAYRAASALLLLSPYTPLLFQGQEWAASTPFLFFTDHNPELGKLVTEGRRQEFVHFKGFSASEVPDPQAESTFLASRLNWNEASEHGHSQTLELYRELLHLRKELPALKTRSRENFKSAHIGGEAIAMRYITGTSGEDLLVLVNLNGEVGVELSSSDMARPPDGLRWEVILSTDEPRFDGMHSIEAQQAEVDAGLVKMNKPVAVVLRAVH